MGFIRAGSYDTDTTHPVLESESGIGQPLSSPSNLHPVSLFICLLLHVRAESDGAHDPVAKLLVQNRLISVAVVLYHLKQTINQWILWWHLKRSSTVGPLVQLLS